MKRKENQMTMVMVVEGVGTSTPDVQKRRAAFILARLKQVIVNKVKERRKRKKEKDKTGENRQRRGIKYYTKEKTNENHEHINDTPALDGLDNRLHVRILTHSPPTPPPAPRGTLAVNSATSISTPAATRGQQPAMRKHGTNTPRSKSADGDTRNSRTHTRTRNGATQKNEQARYNTN